MGHAGHSTWKTGKMKGWVGGWVRDTPIYRTPGRRQQEKDRVGFEGLAVRGCVEEMSERREVTLGGHGTQGAPLSRRHLDPCR